MEEANHNHNPGRRKSTMEHLSLKLENYPRDLLHRFMASNPHQTHLPSGVSKEEEGDNPEELELNLGLSMGGKFGVDKSSKQKLLRSSSIACSFAIRRDDDVLTPPPRAAYPGLARTSSLPAETEEEWRKRKELQTLRRLAAKRRRSEKQRNSRAAERDAAPAVDRSLPEEERKEVAAGSPAAAASGLVAWMAAAARIDLNAKGKGFGQPSSQGSGESQGNSSSGMSVSESESKPVQGANSCGDSQSPASNQSLQEQSTLEAVGSSGTKIIESLCGASGDNHPCKKPEHAENRVRDFGMSMEDMPCVFTKGDGPNGKRIEGILYKYGKGQEVRIMCVCHGSFLSPAEFVKHAGGNDVAHPLRHIVVNTSASLLL